MAENAPLKITGAQWKAVMDQDWGEDWLDETVFRFRGKEVQSLEGLYPRDNEEIFIICGYRCSPDGRYVDLIQHVRDQIKPCPQTSAVTTVVLKVRNERVTAFLSALEQMPEWDAIENKGEVMAADVQNDPRDMRRVSVQR